MTKPKTQPQQVSTTKWRDYSWFGARSPYGARLIGAMMGIALVLPVVLATFLERAYDDMTETVVLATLAFVFLAAGLIAFKKKFLIIPLVMWAAAVGCAACLVIGWFVSW